MKLSRLLDVMKSCENIEIYAQNDVSGEHCIFKGLMWDFYISPLGRDRYHKYYTKQVDEIQSEYVDDYDDTFITITIINN